MLSVRSAALVALIVVGCAPTASGPTPPASTSPTQPATASATLPARFQDSSSPLPAVAGALVLFQLPSETGLHAISFGAEVNGILGGQVAQTTPGAGWSQSPYGVPYLVGTTAYGRDGKALGPIPWPATATKTWSSEGRFLCAAVPAAATAGAQMRLERAVIGQPAKVIASGYTTYSDNASYRVLACDEGTDRAIVASFGQGVAAGRLWVFRLSTGAVVRSVDYAGGWVAASADGSTLAESVRQSGGGKWTATIRSADDGAQLGTIDDFAVQGFSGDKTLVVGPAGGTALAPGGPTVAVIDWKARRKVWTTSGPYGGFLAEPAGRRLAVGVGFVGGSDQRDVYLVAPDGAAVLLPARVRVALLY
ncbi:MAG: hypothetical protein ACRDG6_11030 [Candidatus Limnocylindria bacterium]